MPVGPHGTPGTELQRRQVFRQAWPRARFGAQRSRNATECHATTTSGPSSQQRRSARMERHSGRRGRCAGGLFGPGWECAGAVDRLALMPVEGDFLRGSSVRACRYCWDGVGGRDCVLPRMWVMSLGPVGSVVDQPVGAGRRAAAGGPVTAAGCCTMEAMNVEVSVVADCPHQSRALELAEAGQFAGSPSFAMNGRDVVEVRDRAAWLTCRLYQGADGLLDFRALRQAFKGAVVEVVAR